MVVSWSFTPLCRESKPHWSQSAPPAAPRATRPHARTRTLACRNMIPPGGSVSVSRLGRPCDIPFRFASVNRIIDAEIQTPRTSRKVSVKTAPERPEDFSLFLGGPLYQLLLRAGLVRPPLDRLKWRLLVIVALAWVPLVVLTILEGRFLGGVKIPFLRDIEVQVRMLVSLPLLIAAEITIHNRMTVLVRQFRERKVVTDALEEPFREIQASAMRLRNSVAFEAGLAVVVFL